MKTATSLLVLSSILLCGCESVVKYPAQPDWQSGVKILGPVKADSGFWPLSLHTMPSDYTFYSALRDNASKQYLVPESKIVIGEMTVTIGSEMDGTIRDWRASALAGEKTNDVPVATSQK